MRTFFTSALTMLFPAFAARRAQPYLLFCRSLHTLLKAGVPLPEAIQTTARAMTNRALLGVLSILQEDVYNGVPLSEAMEKHPAYFSHAGVMYLQIAQRAGQLAQGLEELASDLEAHPHCGLLLPA